MDRRGDSTSNLTLTIFLLAVAVTSGIAMLNFVESVSKQKTFLMEKDAVDIASSLNVLPLSNGNLEVNHKFRQEFSYSIKEGTITVSDKKRLYISSEYSNPSISKKDNFLVIKNEQKS